MLRVGYIDFSLRFICSMAERPNIMRQWIEPSPHSGAAWRGLNGCKWSTTKQAQCYLQPRHERNIPKIQKSASSSRLDPAVEAPPWSNGLHTTGNKATFLPCLNKVFPLLCLHHGESFSVTAPALQHRTLERKSTFVMFLTSIFLYSGVHQCLPPEGSCGNNNDPDLKWESYLS